MDTCSGDSRQREGSENVSVLDETAVSELVRKALECVSLSEALVTGMMALIEATIEAYPHLEVPTTSKISKEEIRRVHTSIRDAWISERKPLADFQPNFLPAPMPIANIRKRVIDEGTSNYDQRLGHWD